MNAVSPVHYLLIATAALAMACGGAQEGSRPDARSMLREGRYDDAISAVEQQKTRTPADVGLVALATLAKNPKAATGKAVAVKLSGSVDPQDSARAAKFMLDLAPEISAPPSADFDLLLCETAIGAVGYGRFSAGRPRTEVPQETSRSLAIAVLERLNIQVASIVVEDLTRTRLLEVWNGCYALLNNSLQMTSEYQVWRLFVCLAELSIRLWSDEQRDSFASALVETAIATVESNPAIGPAVRCDLASPYERLRSTISGKRSLMADLERALASAMGCRRGQYAPPPDNP